jgi:hypothetical protein
MVSDKAFIIAGTALVVGTLFGLASPTLAANEAEPKVTKTIIIRHHDGAEGVREEKDIVLARLKTGFQETPAEWMNFIDQAYWNVQLVD